MKYFLGIDIGASSGRHIVGYRENNELKMVEVYRFTNDVLTEDGHLVWNLDIILKEVKEGIKIALSKYPKIESMSIDTWGVDYVLMNGKEEILPCYCYRDKRTKDVISKVHELISFDELYKITGTQFQEFNTIYQLYCDKLNNRLDKATAFLHIPEYLMYKLTGVMAHEYTNASTTGLLDGVTNDYSKLIISKLGLKESLFTKLYKPGYVLGGFTKETIKEVGSNIKVVLCPTHDTASAVYGIPMKGNAPYISSGTWSLLGIKTREVINTIDARCANYSNEYGPNYIRFQKNIMGLWIIQRLVKEMNLDFSSMVKLAKISNYEFLFDVNDTAFLSSLNMKEEIIKWYNNHNIKAPTTNEDIINATYLSLAKSYKDALDELETIMNTKYDVLYIVGGGAKNEYLNELTEKYTGKKVIALAIEATARGNLLSQMEADNA